MDEQKKKKPRTVGQPEASENVATLADGQEQTTTEIAAGEPLDFAPDRGMFMRFLAMLDESAETFTFQSFTDTKPKPKPDPLAQVRHGTPEELWDWAVGVNRRGAGVFCTVNETDGLGRKADNIRRLRAIWQEDDGEGKPLPLEPHLVVESSPGKFHRYVLADDLSPDQFVTLMDFMVRFYGSDPNAADKSRVLRAPGLYHLKDPKKPHLVRLVSESLAQPYSAEAIVGAFGAAVTREVAAQPVAQREFIELDGTVVEQLRSALRAIGPDERATWVKVGHCLSQLGAVGQGLWLEWSTQSPKWQSDDAALWNGFRGDRAGYKGIFAMARANGWQCPVGADDLDGNTTSRSATLPGWPDELLDLPHGLGEVQRWVLGRMMYPSAATAGVTAFALVSAFAMGHITVDSYGGLGLNEQYLMLAPTGFGKEELRKPFTELDYYMRNRMRPSGERFLPHMAYSTPASQQGLHQLLESHNVQCFLADEFAEWLRHAATDSHKQAALGHVMQAYSKANGVLEAPHAVTNQYGPVVNPRLLIFAMSTAERMLEAMTSSQGDSGAINRFVIHVAEQERIPKKYDGLVYKPSDMVLELFDWLQYQPPLVMSQSPEAYELFKARDSGMAEPLRFSNNALAARLSEQAIKMAAIVALSDHRKVIEYADLDLAYKVREGMYHRAAALIGHDGAISGLHATGIAVQQLTKVFKKTHRVYRSALGSRSRKYESLSVNDQAAVVRMLIANGTAQYGPAGEHVLDSRVYGMS